MSAAETKAYRFIVEQGVAVESLDADALLDAFDGEMGEGLAGRDSTLEMIPTFMSIDKPVPTGEPVIVMDAGGTNLRVATVTFDAGGKATIAKSPKRSMPGIDRELGRDAFFDELVEDLMPVIDTSDRIGFCFSYPAEITPDRDGRLLYWTKQIRAPEVVGAFIGKGILERLRERGYEKTIAILNDTIATLLAGKSVGGSRRYASYIGFILGTGTNTAYVEQNANITKRSDLDEGAQAINIESGGFGRGPRTAIDLAFDATTTDPGRHTFEKMISGGYLGGVSLRAIKTAAEAGLLSAEAADFFAGMSELTTIEMDDFARNPFVDNVLGRGLRDTGDRVTAVVIFRAMIARAAFLTGVNISAAVLRCGEGHDMLHPVCVNVDGSTFYKTYRFQSLVEEHLRRILGPRGVHYELIKMDDSPVMGAAVAGLAG